MEGLPVRLLTELITSDEILTAEGVRETHNVQFCPVGVCLPYESNIYEKCQRGDEELSEYRYTPRAWYAIKVWEAARHELLSQAEFTGVLDIEWCPVAATFNSIRYVNGYPDVFIKRMFEAMERIADAGSIDVKYGRFDEPATKKLPDYSRRYYIMPPDLFASKRNYGINDELDPIQGNAAEKMSWKDIKDAFVVLKPIQLAFIAGEPMNRHSPLDLEFIDACIHLDFDKVRELVEKGANIHAAGEYGETALSEMTYYYEDSTEEGDNGGIVENDRNYGKYIRIAEYLISLGYNVNLAGYCDGTPLYSTKYGQYLRIARFLLENGADPNEPSFIGDEYGLGTMVLEGVWDSMHDEPWDSEYVYAKENENLGKLAKILLSWGALPVSRNEKYAEDELDYWIEKRKEAGDWNTSHCEKLNKFDKALVNCARGLWFYKMALLAQNGGNINLKDDLGRNLLLIALEDAQPASKENIVSFQDNLMEMTMMLLCGLKLQLNEAEFEQAKQICRDNGYAGVLEAIELVVNKNHL